MQCLETKLQIIVNVPRTCCNQSIFDAKTIESMNKVKKWLF